MIISYQVTKEIRGGGGLFGFGGSVIRRESTALSSILFDNEASDIKNYLIRNGADLNLAYKYK